MNREMLEWRKGCSAKIEAITREYNRETGRYNVAIKIAREEGDRARVDALMRERLETQRRLVAQRDAEEARLRAGPPVVALPQVEMFAPTRGAR